MSSLATSKIHYTVVGGWTGRGDRSGEQHAVVFSQGRGVETISAQIAVLTPTGSGERYVVGALHLQREDVSAAAWGQLILDGQPNDGDTWRISDGTQTVDFEFDNDASVVETPTLRQVVIGVDVDATLTNLLTAINSGAYTFEVTASNEVSDRIDIQHDTAGVSVPTTIEQVNVSGNLRSFGMDFWVTAGKWPVSTYLNRDERTTERLRVNQSFDPPVQFDFAGNERRLRAFIDDIRDNGSSSFTSSFSITTGTG